MTRIRWLKFLTFTIPTWLVLGRVGEYAYSQTSPFSDLTISHLPYAEYIRMSLSQLGQIPLWYPGLFGGMPLAAHPLAGFWYVPGWAGILLPAPIGFNLALALHMVAAGLGMYLLLKSEGVGELAAMLGGLAFELTPKLLAHWAAGHVSLCFAYSLTPWLLYCESKATQKNSWRWIGLTAITLTLITLADIRWAAFAGLGWLGFRLYHLFGRGLSLTRVWDWLLKSFVIGGLTLLLAAPFLFDFLQFTALSTRTGLSGAERSQFGLPLDQLLGMVYPDFGGYAEWVFYPGALSVILMGMLLFAKGGWKRAGYWLILLISSLVLAIGSSLVENLPLFNLMRVSSRFTFLFCLAAAILLGIGVDAMLRKEEAGIRFGPASWLAGAGIAGLSGFLATAVWLGSGRLPMEMIWGGSFFLLGMGFLFLLRYGWPGVRWAMAGFVILICLDLGVAGNSQLRWVKAEVVEQEGLRIANLLSQQEAVGRIYSPSYQVPQLIAERANLDMLSGIDPMQLTSFVNYMESATRIPIAGYSVPIPPLDADRVFESNRGIVPDAWKLAWMNVGRLVTGERLQSTRGWELAGEVDGVYLYRNTLQRPQAWVQTSSLAIDGRYTEAIVVAYSPNRIRLAGEGPGVLVLSEIYYPGWRVKVDGQPAEIEQIAGLLRAVKIGEGRHDIVFTYWPRWLTAGLVAGAIGILLLMGLIIQPRGRDVSVQWARFLNRPRGQRNDNSNQREMH